MSLVIIGILTSLLLSSIAKAREAATIAQCHNYRRQLTIYYFAAHDEQDYDPSYRNIAMFNVKRELMPDYSVIQSKCYDCHASVPHEMKKGFTLIELLAVIAIIGNTDSYALNVRSRS